MKTTIELSYEYNDAFVDVGRKIAKGNPPLWLLVGLNHFSEGIGANAASQMPPFIDLTHDAAQTLLRWLPVFQHLGFGYRCPDDVAVVLDRLPRIVKDLERLRRRKIGRKRNVPREVCAAVVVEAWKLLHRKAEPRGEALMESLQRVLAGLWLRAHWRD
jgi:hypothetical protein